MEHYNYFSHLTHDPDWQKFAMAALVGCGLLVVGKKVASAVTSSAAREQAIVPASKLSLFGFFDLFIEGWVSYHDSVLGKENRKYVPFTCGIFLFLLVSNLIGLLPGVPALTTTVWMNVGMALVVFVYFNYLGIKENGIVGYLKHFAGPVWWLAWFMFPLEIFSLLLRPFTLNLRLFWNITADHQVLDIFTNLVPYGVPVVFYGLGTFVCCMQAFIFTTLTMIYILLATQHEEEGHH